MPVSSNYTTINVENEKRDPHSMLNLYRALIIYRRLTPAITLGSYKSHPSPEGTFIYVREHGDQRVLVALNFTDQPQTLELGLQGQAQIEITSYLDVIDKKIGLANFMLRPNEGLVLKL